MRKKPTVFVVAFCLLMTMTAFAADDANVGTWKLNESKSTFPAGAGKNQTVECKVDGTEIMCTMDGVDGLGNPLHSEWVGRFDGENYYLSGDPSADTRSIKKEDDRRYKVINRKGGKVTGTGTIEFSPDGNTRTVKVSSVDDNGKKVNSIAVYDRQM